MRQVRIHLAEREGCWRWSAYFRGIANIPYTDREARNKLRSGFGHQAATAEEALAAAKAWAENHPARKGK